MNYQTILDFFKNQPSYRQKQVDEFLFAKGVGLWEEMTSLPASLREELAQKISLEIEAEFFESEDKSQKAIVTLEDGEKIETVLMLNKDKSATVCLSSQVGCAMGCDFCATGELGFKRNLAWQEILEQYVLWQRRLKGQNIRISNLVVMGMGEPFLNYDNVLGALKFFNKNKAINIAARKISISTVGIVKGIERLGKEAEQFNLAISLHAASTKIRQEIMPSAKKYKISEIIEAVDMYLKKTGRKVMIEYLLLKNINDGGDEADKLVKLLQGKLVVVNLMNYNGQGKYEKTTRERVEIFKKKLTKARIENTVRRSYGQDIYGACGQLANKE